MNDHKMSVPGMGKAQRACVEALTVKAQLRFFSSINCVTQNGVTDVSHVYPDLMGSAGFQSAAHMGVAGVAADNLPVGDGIFGITGGDAHFLSVGGVTANGGIHSAFILL